MSNSSLWSQLHSPVNVADLCCSPCSCMAAGNSAASYHDNAGILFAQVTIPTLGEASAEALAPLLGGLPLELRPKMETFIQGVYAVRR